MLKIYHVNILYMCIFPYHYIKKPIIIIKKSNNSNFLSLITKICNNIKA